MGWITNLVIALVLILILDFIWLGLVAKNLYKNEIGEFYKDKFNLYAATIVYILLGLAVTFIVLNNNMSTNNLNVFLIGALVGVIIYGVYDFTNLAIVKDWPLKIAIIDTLWGGVLIGVVSFLTKYFSEII